ncbi:hypothetical protein EZV61_19330 [Corallincola luteus]|uniref:Distal membrane arm assembly complex 2-like protein n=1 Tax=Corallincola luteus TaxID=1775177 RepID=A0ABY2AFA8_9GAMM|nr:hypothetical protein [Corallincola luteus]TCI01070.1 hypothetical protein EZV61_19330 [Corallincola luteus]
MNRIYPYSCTTTRCDTGDVILDEKFNLRLSHSASLKELELIELSKRAGGGVHWAPILPHNWDGLTQEKKSDIVESNEFDIKVEGIYFRNEVNLEDIQKITAYPEIDGLHIMRSTLKDEDVRLLTCFVNLDHLRLRGIQFSDVVIEYVAELKKLRNLDIFETSISESGVSKLNRLLPNCSIWGP